MKKFTAVLLSAILLFTFAACSSGTEEDTTAAETATSASGENGTDAAPANFDLSGMTAGKITKISGNQVTLDLGTIDEDSVEKPSMPEGVSAPEDGSAPGMPEGASAPEDMPEDFDPENMPEGFDPENMPEGFDPENMPEGASMPDGGGFSGSITAEVEYTGESAVFTIPAEVKVGSGDYTSLSKGDVIALGFDDDGAVSTVMLITEKGTD